MKKHRNWIPGAAALALGLLFSAGCGDDGSTDPGDGGSNGTHENPVVAAFEAVSEAADAIFTGNEELFASLQYFGPEVGTSFSAASSRRTAVRQSCIPSSKQGKVFIWDTGSNGYSGVDSSMAPAGGAIYVLYRMEGAVPRVPLVETGYIKAECADRQSPQSDSLTVTLVNTVGGIDREVAKIGFSGLFYDPEYYFRTSKGTLMSGGVELHIDPTAAGWTGSDTGTVYALGEFLNGYFANCGGEDLHLGMLESCAPAVHDAGEIVTDPLLFLGWFALVKD